jgi:hypothetical protein
VASSKGLVGCWAARLHGSIWITGIQPRLWRWRGYELGWIREGYRHMEKENHESNDIIVMMRQNGIPESDQ